METLHKYKNILGTPKKGFHARRIAGLAANDIIITLAVASIIAWNINYPICYTFIALFGIGTLTHLLFGVETPITNTLTSTLKKISIQIFKYT